MILVPTHRTPTHPGVMLLEEFLAPMGITQRELADAIAVTFTGVNVDRVVNGRIVEHGGAANLLGPLLEIGAVRVVGDRAPDS